MPGTKRAYRHVPGLFVTTWRKAMNTGTTRTVMLGLATLSMSMMAGCASESASRRDANTATYQEAVDRAQASIQQAGQGASSEYGSADLNRAREKLDEARRFNDAGNETMAERLAVEADLDAEVALA